MKNFRGLYIDDFEIDLDPNFDKLGIKTLFCELGVMEKKYQS